MLFTTVLRWLRMLVIIAVIAAGIYALEKICLSYLPGDPYHLPSQPFESVSASVPGVGPASEVGGLRAFERGVVTFFRFGN